MEDEWLDLVDENDTVIGRKLRSEVKAEGLTNYRVINAFLRNSHGQLGVPRRTAAKSSFPRAFDFSVGGHVESGESYEQAYKREAREELNIDVNEYRSRFLGSMNPHGDGVAAFMYVYEIFADDTPRYNEDDFSEFVWLLPTELLARYEAGEQMKDDLPKVVRKYFI